MEKSGIFFQIEKASKASGDLTCYVFSLEDALADLGVTDAKEGEILTIEK